MCFRLEERAGGYKSETTSFMCQKNEVGANGREEKNCVKTLLPSIIILEVFSSEAAVFLKIIRHIACQTACHTAECGGTWSVLETEGCLVISDKVCSLNSKKEVRETAHPTKHVTMI
jgi:hypothetical protein